MSNDAQVKSFKYVNRVKDQAEITKTWSPNKLDAKYAEEEIMSLPDQKRGHKRSKYSTSTKSGSYANAVKSTDISGSTIHVIQATTPTVSTMSTEDIETIALLKDKIKKLEERQEKTDEKISNIEVVTQSTNEVVALTQQSLVTTQNTIETNRIDVMKVLLEMQAANAAAQALSIQQFNNLQSTLINQQAKNNKENQQPHDPNAMDAKFTDTPGGNQSTCDGRSPLGSSTAF